MRGERFSTPGKAVASFKLQSGINALTTGFFECKSGFLYEKFGFSCVFPKTFRVAHVRASEVPRKKMDLLFF